MTVGKKKYIVSPKPNPHVAAKEPHPITAKPRKITSRLVIAFISSCALVGTSPLGNISFWDLLSEIRSLQARAQPFSSRVFLLGVRILYRNQYSAKLFARQPCVTPYSHQILAHVFSINKLGGAYVFDSNFMRSRISSSSFLKSASRVPSAK